MRPKQLSMAANLVPHFFFCMRFSEKATEAAATQVNRPFASISHLPIITKYLELYSSIRA